MRLVGDDPSGAGVGVVRDDRRQVRPRCPTRAGSATGPGSPAPRASAPARPPRRACSSAPCGTPPPYPRRRPMPASLRRQWSATHRAAAAGRQRPQRRLDAVRPHRRRHRIPPLTRPCDNDPAADRPGSSLCRWLVRAFLPRAAMVAFRTQAPICAREHVRGQEVIIWGLTKFTNGYSLFPVRQITLDVASSHATDTRFISPRRLGMSSLPIACPPTDPNRSRPSISYYLRRRHRPGTL